MNDKNIIMYRGKPIEVYNAVKIKQLKWAEDLAILPNLYCPLCGQKFKLDETVVEVETTPVLVISGDYKSDGLILAIHMLCLIEALEGKENDE
jgi:hypothetical protein